MFDFIKRLFSKKAHSSTSHDVPTMDVVEGNDIEILKTSEYSEGASADAIERLVADKELPPPELDLPAAQLDEPSNEPELVHEEEEEEEEKEEPDNYMLGDLKAARKKRDNQARKAGMQYWNDGVMKYRPRQDRPAAEGTAAPQFNYFDVLRDEPMLRQVELQYPGMAIEHLNLSKYMNNTLKGKMVSEYVLRSMKLIREQEQNGAEVVSSSEPATAGGAELRDAHNKTLRDLFNALEAQQAVKNTEESQAGNSVANYDEQAEFESENVEEMLHHFEDLVNQIMDYDNKESYTRWLLSVAEDGAASADIMWLLVEDPNPDVRFCLAENYNIEPEMLKMLSEDENPYVAHRAQKTMMRMNRAAGQVVDRDFGNAGENDRLRKSS